MKIFLSSIALCCAGIFMGCQEDEELNLLGYPENPVSIVTPGESGDLSCMKVKATYNEDGKLVTSTSLRRTWTVSLATPSPEDVVLQFAPYSINIPTDKIELSETTVRIPAGYVSASVTVGLKDDDFSFAEENLDAETYELGFNVVNAEGLNLKTESAIGKMTIEKDPYLVHVGMEGETGNIVSMKRICRNGEILGGAVEYSFMMQLDRPVLEDLVISFETEGIPEKFKEKANYSPTQVIIPAGSCSSEEVKWTLSDDVLLDNEEDETFNITLKPLFEETDIVSVNPENSNISIVLTKTSSLLELVNSVQNHWAQLDRRDWSATLGAGWSGDPDTFFDNGTWNGGARFVETESSTGEIIIDMGKPENLVGILTHFGYIYSSGYIYLSPLKTQIFVSTDKNEWTSLGEIETEPNKNRHYFNLVIPMEARYVKYITTVDSNLAQMQITEFKFYEEYKE